MEDGDGFISDLMSLMRTMELQHLLAVATKLGSNLDDNKAQFQQTVRVGIYSPLG